MNMKSEELPKKKKSYNFADWFWIIILIIIVGIWFYNYNQPKEEDIFRQQQTNLYKKVSDKSFEFKKCYLEIESYFNTNQYVLVNQKINTCRTIINEARTELDALSRLETDETFKREYRAMGLDFQGAVISLDITYNLASALSGSLTQEELEINIETNKVLIAQYLDIIKELETQYSDTYLFKNNYATQEGSKMLQQAKKNYQELLEQYNNRTN